MHINIRDHPTLHLDTQ